MLCAYLVGSFSVDRHPENSSDIIRYLQYLDCDSASLSHHILRDDSSTLKSRDATTHFKLIYFSLLGFIGDSPREYGALPVRSGAKYYELLRGFLSFRLRSTRRRDECRRYLEHWEFAQRFGRQGDKQHVGERYFLVLW